MLICFVLVNLIIYYIDLNHLKKKQLDAINRTHIIERNPIGRAKWSAPVLEFALL